MLWLSFPLAHSVRWCCSRVVLAEGVSSDISFFFMRGECGDGMTQGPRGEDGDTSGDCEHDAVNAQSRRATMMLEALFGDRVKE